jgi:hypothetical protein
MNALDTRSREKSLEGGGNHPEPADKPKRARDGNP